MVNIEDLVKIRVSGNSLAITLPKKIVVSLDWKVGDYIKMSVVENGISLKKVIV